MSELYYPPKTRLPGEKAIDWLGNKLPATESEAITLADTVGVMLFDSVNFTGLNLAAKQQMQKTALQEPTTIRITEGRTAPNWFMQNWHWVVPVGLGSIFLLWQLMDRKR